MTRKATRAGVRRPAQPYPVAYRTLSEHERRRHQSIVCHDGNSMAASPTMKNARQMSNASLRRASPSRRWASDRHYKRRDGADDAMERHFTHSRRPREREGARPGLIRALTIAQDVKIQVES